MKRIFIISILLCLISSCREAEENFSQEELARQDSLALHVAVFPTLETLPLYYAERSGMLSADSLGIRLDHYESMMDCDTALTRGHAHATFTDVARIMALQYEEGFIITPIATTTGTLGLYSVKEKEITRTEQLKEKLIGMERHSHSDYWSDKILEGTDLGTLDIFRIQIGSTHLRYDMMMSGLIDAAFLPQPYSLLCDTTLVNCLWEEPEDQTPWTVLAASTIQMADSTRRKQVDGLKVIYEKARRQLVEQPDTTLLHAILRDDYLIPDRHLRRTHWWEWKPAPLDSVRSQAALEAERWLRDERGRFVK